MAKPLRIWRLANQRVRCAKDRHRPGLWHVPARIAQQGAGEGVARPGAEQAERFGRAQRVELLSGLALLLVVARGTRHARQLLEQRRELMGSGRGRQRERIGRG